jgi:hypothetical protein
MAQKMTMTDTTAALSPRDDAGAARDVTMPAALQLTQPA